MIARRPSLSGEGQAPPEDRKTRDRRKKREKREKLYAQGLTATGKPLKNPKMSKRIQNEHPAGCVCYDCLWGRS